LEASFVLASVPAAGAEGGVPESAGFESAAAGAGAVLAAGAGGVAGAGVLFSLHAATASASDATITRVLSIIRFLGEVKRKAGESVPTRVIGLGIIVRYYVIAEPVGCAVDMGFFSLPSGM
jgi:hypothetical protein